MFLFGWSGVFSSLPSRGLGVGAQVFVGCSSSLPSYPYQLYALRGLVRGGSVFACISAAWSSRCSGSPHSGLSHASLRPSFRVCVSGFSQGLCRAFVSVLVEVRHA